MATGSSIGRRVGRRAAPARKTGEPAAGQARPGQRPPLMAGYVRFGMIADPFTYVDALTTGEPEIPTADSGWDVVSRPLRIDATLWRAGKPLRQSVAITMDVLGQGENASVSDEWQQLQRLWRPSSAAQPPVLKISGPVSRGDLDWVIADLVPDQTSVKRIGGTLVRVEANVQLLQWVPPDLVTDPEDDDTTGGAQASQPRFATAKNNDTLRIIAKRELGNGRRWTEIRDLNPQFKAANDRIPADTRVRLPDGS